MSLIPLSQHRLYNDLVFTSGQIGVNSDGISPPEFRSQMELAMTCLQNQLESAGASLESVLKVTNFIVERDHFAEMNEIYAKYFSEPYPARTTIVTELARADLLFEVEAIAVVERR